VHIVDTIPLAIWNITFHVWAKVYRHFTGLFWTAWILITAVRKLNRNAGNLPTDTTPSVTIYRLTQRLIPENPSKMFRNMDLYSAAHGDINIAEDMLVSTPLPILCG
jgi:hypothetical protein